MDVWLGLNFEFDENFGVHTVKTLHNESIVSESEDFLYEKNFLFTSALTYKSKLDKQTLNWLIGRLGKNR